MTRPKISILILTHNRPALFTRAITSVISNLPSYTVEVLVNNDSRDIEEIYDSRVDIKYYYEHHSDLSETYKLLYDKSSGEHIYYLEDDDYMRKNFFDNLDFEYDVNFFEYISNDLIREMGPLCSLKAISKNRTAIKGKYLKDFLIEFDDENFQLGQMMFRSGIVKEFPTGNDILNDYHLLQELASNNATIKYIKQQKWVQTIDGEDNISFDEFNTDERFRKTV